MDGVSDGTSVFGQHGAARYTSRQILDAEERLLAAAATRTAMGLSGPLVAASLEGFDARGTRLDAGQRQLVTCFATDSRLLVAGLGPAGAGKTTAMRAYAHVAGALASAERSGRDVSTLLVTITASTSDSGSEPANQLTAVARITRRLLRAGGARPEGLSVPDLLAGTQTAAAALGISTAIQARSEPAWPALDAALRRAGSAGHHPETILRTVAEARELDTADSVRTDRVVEGLQDRARIVEPRVGREIGREPLCQRWQPRDAARAVVERRRPGDHQEQSRVTAGVDLVNELPERVERLIPHITAHALQRLDLIEHQQQAGMTGVPQHHEQALQETHRAEMV